MKETFQIEFNPPKETKYLKELIDRFKSIGFTFREVKCTTYYEVNLPNGWKIIFEGGPESIIYDDTGRKRGWLSQKIEKDIPQKIGLYTRYKISSIKRKNGQEFIVIFDRNINKIIYQIGRRCNIDDEFELGEKARDYLNVHYPNWENFAAYWD